jgi:hypothetical protein
VHDYEVGIDGEARRVQTAFAGKRFLLDTLFEDNTLRVDLHAEPVLGSLCDRRDRGKTLPVSSCATRERIAVEPASPDGVGKFRIFKCRYCLSSSVAFHCSGPSASAFEKSVLFGGTSC